MNIKSLTIITLLFLCIIMGFEKISFSLNKSNKDNITELKILNYLPKDSENFFISNLKSAKIINNIKKNYSIKDQEKIALMKDSTLAYLGIDLGTNKLEDIYNNELIISTYENEGKDIDDILIICKIDEKRNIDDILNLPNKIDEPEKLIKIFRENKLNYLNYIYRTNDNYILTSTTKQLILDALDTINIHKKTNTRDIIFKDLLNSFDYENNIYFTKNIETNKILNYEDYVQNKDDYLVTVFNLRDETIHLNSYLINTSRSINRNSYSETNKEKISDKINYPIMIYNDLINSINYIKLNSFEKEFFKELNETLNQNFLLLVSEDNWVTIFNNNENKISIDNIKSLKDFNKYSLENNNMVYKIYSKTILKKEDNIIKEDNYNNIFSAKTDKLTFVSNELIKDLDIDLLSEKFLNLKGESYPKYFLNKRIDLKYPYFFKSKNVAYLENINYFFRNLLNVSIIDFKAIIKQSIPETSPIFYTETNIKIF